mgnify:CR=1 FL=1
MVSKPFLMALRIAKHSLLLEQSANDSFSAYLFTAYYGAAVCGLTVTLVMDFRYAK